MKDIISKIVLFIVSKSKFLLYGLAIFIVYSSILSLYWYNKGIQHKELEIANSPISVTAHKDSTARPQQTITGTVIAKPRAAPQNYMQPIIQKLTKNVDSLQMIVIDQSNELQAQAEMIAWLQEPKLIEINNEIVGHLIMTFYPTDGKADTVNYVFTEPIRYDHHTDSTFTRTVLKDRAWYEVPAYLIGGMVFGALTVEILKP